MPHLYKIRPQAERDLDECAAHIAKDNLDVALRLYDAAEETYQNLAQFQEMGRIYTSAIPDLGDVRCFPIKGFSQYLAFYVSANNHIDIVRVLHASRDIDSILN